MKMKLWAITMNSFRENLRDKILYNIMGFALLLIAASLAIGRLSIAERKRITIDLSLTSISAIGVIIAVFLGISLVSREIDKKTIYTLIAKPVPRWLFLVGRFLGLMLTIALNVLVMSATFALVLWAVGGQQPRQFDWPILQAIILIYLELGIITAVAMLFSTFTTPTLSAIFTLGFFLAGRFTSGVSLLIPPKENPSLYTAARILEYLIPDLSNYVRIEEALFEQGIPLALFLRIILIGLLTITLFLSIAILIFQRRDFV